MRARYALRDDIAYAATRRQFRRLISLLFDTLRYVSLTLTRGARYAMLLHMLLIAAIRYATRCHAAEGALLTMLMPRDVAAVDICCRAT